MVVVVPLFLQTIPEGSVGLPLTVSYDGINLAALENATIRTNFVQGVTQQLATNLNVSC